MSRSKGKRYELEIAKDLESLFPEIHRDWVTQAAGGGIDLANTGDFGFEVKGGKQCNIAKTRKWLDQLKGETDKPYRAVICRPIREEKFVLIPFEDFKNLIKKIIRKD